MALEVETKWNGVKISKDLDEAVFKALTRASNIMQTTAKELVRKDTTALEGSIVKAVKDNKSIASTNMEYAPYVEFGTGRFAENGKGRKTPWYYVDGQGVGYWTAGMKPQPFMRPALNKNKKLIKKIFEEEIKKVYK